MIVVFWSSILFCFLKIEHWASCKRFSSTERVGWVRFTCSNNFFDFNVGVIGNLCEPACAPFTSEHLFGVVQSRRVCEPLQIAFSWGGQEDDTIWMAKKNFILANDPNWTPINTTLREKHFDFTSRDFAEVNKIEIEAMSNSDFIDVLYKVSPRANLQDWAEDRFQN